ncbi:pirin family protein [Rhodococcus spelaei]|uniref:Pirin family protein n=1 Tax=Rhodococcus spelaei TaxID=2546320 RepID=A0A541B1T6_9NOCA|nr:pirin family protein [Rhodococcus spelaei]TQF66293.1 pirin family protein [Rhodococcus spelaei]
MSNLETAPRESTCGGLAGTSATPAHEVYAGREVMLGETVVTRLLPNLGRRLVGPWCFIDHYGPDDIEKEPGMSVPPHPHTGLQTVSWLLDGEIRHRDSIGSDQEFGPGQLGLMTAGRAIAHAEHSPARHPRLLHGAQLWVALPEAHRHGAPSWEHHADLPVLTGPGHRTTVILGELAGARSPGTTYSPLVGADVEVTSGTTVLLPLERDFEHAVLVMSGIVEVDGTRIGPGTMLYLGCARTELAVSAEVNSKLLLLGGEPFEEQIVMWWNFVARSHEEIVAARTEYMEGSEFGVVRAYDGPQLPAPALPPGPLRPGGATR